MNFETVGVWLSRVLGFLGQLSAAWPKTATAVTVGTGAYVFPDAVRAALAKACELLTALGTALP